MAISTNEAGDEVGSWLLLEMVEGEVEFYQRFVKKHGGALVAMAQPADSYRLDFPPGTHIAPNEELDVPLQDSYHIVYPDGTRLTWYRIMKLDRRWLCNVLVAPVDNEDRAYFTEQTGKAAASRKTNAV